MSFACSVLGMSPQLSSPLTIASKDSFCRGATAWQNKNRILPATQLHIASHSPQLFSSAPPACSLVEKAPSSCPAWGGPPVRNTLLSSCKEGGNTNHGVKSDDILLLSVNVLSCPLVRVPPCNNVRVWQQGEEVEREVWRFSWDYGLLLLGNL